MKFDFALAGFCMFATMWVCGFVSAFALCCTEELKKAAIATAVMTIGVAMAGGIGGAIW